MVDELDHEDEDDEIDLDDENEFVDHNDVQIIDGEGQMEEDEMIDQSELDKRE